AYEGGVELFKTEPAILLLAWLRIMDNPTSNDGWSVVLEEAGYTLPAARAIINSDTVNNKKYPEDMWRFRKRLLDLRKSAPRIWPAAVARSIFDRYGFCDGFTDKLAEVVQETASSSLMGLGELVEFVEDNIEAATTYEVDNPQAEAITVQTIHAAKGLEYPVVFVSDVNSSRFPGRGSSTEEIVYRDPVGLRQKKIYYDDPELPYLYDNWCSEFVLRPLAGEYDEERRLMYVALTRAQQYLYLSAQPEKASPFFNNLCSEMEVENIDSPQLEKVDYEPPGLGKMEIEQVSELSPQKISVHDIIEQIAVDEAGRGAGYGRQVHEFAENYARRKKADVNNPDQENIARWLDGLSGRLLIEQDCLLPLEVQGRRVTLSGRIDLIVIDDSKVTIVDYKTDLSRENEPEYQKQLSVYYHVVREIYPELPVAAKLFYTADDELVPIEPLSIERLKEEAIRVMGMRKR
ncbi:MAG: 3'-5' exonuclease, partial [bacterium]